MTALRTVMDASLLAHQRGDAATLAVVVQTEGSTYVRAGALALFTADAVPIGWLSGGCLEPEIARCAAEVAQRDALGWMCIDTRDDEDLFAGSAVGCRGKLHIALLPLQDLDQWPQLVNAWQTGQGALHLNFVDDGVVDASLGLHRQHWEFAEVESFHDAPIIAAVELALPPPPSLLVLGAGPETAFLLPLLRRLGWMATLVERRPRWQSQSQYADTFVHAGPEELSPRLGNFDAALVMHHHFDMDREALIALAAGDVPFIGLLGPRRRREDLFKLIPETLQTRLSPRLHSPVGIKLGGQGPEAIALSIAAQLQQLYFGERE